MFRVAALARLNAIDERPGDFYKMKKEDGDSCNEPLSKHHWQLCKCGTSRLRPHNALSKVFAKIVESNGGFVNVERCVPTLSTKDSNGLVIDSILDVVYHFAGGPMKCIDFTIRSPMA